MEKEWEEVLLYQVLLKKIMDLPEIGNMSGTNSANPIACNAGLAVLEEIQVKKLTNKAKRNGQFI